MTPRRTRAKQGALTALALSAVAGLTLSGLPQGVAAPAGSADADRTESPARSTPRERKGDFDARDGSLKSQLNQARNLLLERSPALDRLSRGLGSQAVVDIDPLTGTPRNLARLDGFLTGPSSAPARVVALRYVRSHARALGLTQADLATFQLSRDYVDVAGIHHLSWIQVADGVPVFGNGLRANVTKSGQLLSVQGSPVSGLVESAGRAETTPALSAAAARTRAASDVGGKAAQANARSDSAGQTSWSNDDQAGLVWFATPSGVRLGWSTYVQAGSDLNYQHVIDAKSGSVLYRHDTVNFDRGDALVYDNYPGAPSGGRQRVRNLIDAGYLGRKADDLSGRYTLAWSDVNDDNRPNKGERVPVPGSGPKEKPGYRLVAYNNASPLCSRAYICTWDPDRARSWKVNRRADVTQGFYYNSMYHDYLERKPFGFTVKAGNFESRGGDPVLLNSLDGADTAGGLPDGNHIDNANMNTPPDGVAPTMQMYLFHYPGTTAAEEPYLPTSSSFDPSVIFHEYTHGLSNRLVVDAQGNSTLNSIQAKSMGEAWSDYYAMDLLVHRGRTPDTKKSGEVFEGSYLLADKFPFRTMAIDCAVGSKAPGCASPVVPEDGGYTYGDFPIIGGAPEVHSSGEVWAQTLWDIRKSLGHKVTGMIATRAMSLSPNDPSMLDERNAIIQADLAVYGGAHRAKLWRIFANRGMGFFAGSLGAEDSFPAEDFSLPPSPDAPRATVSGRVVDPLTHQPVANAFVTIPGHDSGFIGDYSAVTTAGGRYTIPNVFVGRYPLAAVFAPGYEVVKRALRVRPAGTTANFRVRRDWAASSGGGAITDFNGPDYTPDCGPTGAIDLSQGTGWGSTTGDDAATPTNDFVPKFIEVRLPAAITLTSFAVDPTATCGDPGSSSTGDYSIEVSRNGNAWTTAAEGTFTSADQRRLVEVPVDSPIANVRYVRFNIEGNQVPDFETNCPDGAYGGCTFTDMTELEVFGTN